MQGETCDKLRIDLNTSEKDLGETYTAFSRVQKLNDLMIVGLDESRYKRHYELPPAKKENYKVLQEEIIRLKKLSNETFGGDVRYIPLYIKKPESKKRTPEQYQNEN